MFFFIVAVVVPVLIVIIAAVSVILIIVVTLHKSHTRKCKFDKLYENVSTSHIQVKGQCHKNMKKKLSYE